MQEDWQRSLANYHRLMTKVKVDSHSIPQARGAKYSQGFREWKCRAAEGHHEEGPFRIYVKSAS